MEGLVQNKKVQIALKVVLFIAFLFLLVWIGAHWDPKYITAAGVQETNRILLEILEELQKIKKSI